MNFSIEPKNLAGYLAKQLEHFYPDEIDVRAGVERILPSVIERMDHCFSHIHKKYYFENQQTLFNHLNSDHYAMFLYWVANEAFKHQLINLAEKAFLLNKALHGVDAFYSVSLPEVFLFVHPIGTILGNAQYSDYFVVYQNVTIGTDVNGIYPAFGKGTVLYSKSSVIGHCTLGDNVSIAANSFIRNLSVPDDSLVVGLYPDMEIKKNKKNNIQSFFSSSLII